MVGYPTDPDEPETPSPNHKHVTKTVSAFWRSKVRPLSTNLKCYMSALQCTHNLTEGESRESGTAIRAVIDLRSRVEECYLSFITEIEEMDHNTILKGLDQDASTSSTSRNATAAVRKRREHFQNLKLRLTDKLEELDLAMDKIEASHLEFLKKFPGAGGSMATQGQPAPSRPTRYQPVNLILDSESKDKPWVLGSTQVIPHSQLTTMKMWLESGGAFSDVEEPIRYIKTLCDMQTKEGGNLKKLIMGAQLIP